MSFEAITKLVKRLLDFLLKENFYLDFSIVIIATLLALRAVMHDNWNEATFFLLCGFIIKWEVRWGFIRKRIPPTGFL